MSDLAGDTSLAERRQIMLVALGVIVTAAVLGLAYMSFFRTSYVVLLSGLRPSDAAAVVTVLQKEKTPYRLADKGATIEVPEQMADASRLSIASSDIPLKGAVGFEIFNKSDMGLTDLAQRVNYQRALQGELVRTIMTLDGVDSARVHLTLPEEMIFQRDRTPAKASVTVIMQMGRTLSPAAIAGIQHLVASSVNDLDAADVVVLDGEGDVVSSDRISTATQTSPEMEQTAAIEQYYVGRIREGLQGGDRLRGVQVSILALVGRRQLGAPQRDEQGLEGAVGYQGAGDRFVNGFSPQARPFGLRVIVTVPGDMPPDDRQKVAEVVRAAIAFDASKGDEITFGMPIPSEAAGTVPWASAVRGDGIVRHAAPAPASDASGRIALTATITAILTGLALTLAWLWSNRRLSRSRRLALVTQLSRELEAMERTA